jgi:DNA-binding response OmpR family regulator
MIPRIAIIEDDPEISSMLEKLLRMDGFEVTVFPDGRPALPILRSGDYDAAILDVMLPGKDGITIMQEIRSAAETERLPVLMLTAKTDDASTFAGWKAGCNYFMNKPFDPVELVEVLRRVLAG